MPATTVATATPDEKAVRRLAARRARYTGQRVLWKETKLRRVAFCGRVLANGVDGVSVKVSGTPGTGDARAGFSGLQTCGSVWACTVCSEKINAGRQAELQAGIENWMTAGHAVVFGTLTLRHNAGHSLKDLWDAIGPAWSAVTSKSTAWRGGRRQLGDKDRFGIKGYVRLVETKHGQNGWHPHVHFLLFLDHALDVSHLRDLENRMFGRWETALAKKGLSVIQKVGIDLRPVAGSQDVLASYFTKATYATPAAAAYEVTGSQSKRQGKGGRSPFQILAALVNADTGELPEGWSPEGWERDRRLWWEWEKASKGRRQLTWSRGCRDMLGLNDEKTDDQLAEEDHGGDVVHTFTADEWKGWKLYNRRADLLDMAETGQLRRLYAGRRGTYSHVAWGEKPRGASG